MCDSKYKVLLYCRKLVFRKKGYFYDRRSFGKVAKQFKEAHSDKVNSMLSVDGFLKFFQ